MLGLENQVCSLELSIKLKELGVNQESLFYWYKDKKDEDRWKIFQLYGLNIKLKNGNECVISAFNAVELGNMLPSRLQGDSGSTGDSFLNMTKYFNNTNVISYVVSDNLTPIICIIDDLEVNARAKMLIFLLENELIKMSKIIYLEK
jgi:hypothetical protein